MNSRPSVWSRPLSVFVLVTAAFAGGMLVERSGRLLAPYHYTPAGLEQTFAPFWETWAYIDRYYVDRAAVQPEKMTRAAIEALVNSLGDRGHSTYLTADELERMKQGLKGQLLGIGVRLSVRRLLPTVVSTLPGSPARAAGLRPGDVFVEVDGKDVTHIRLDVLTALVRGPEGKAVHIRVAREGSAQPLDFDITRAQVEVADVAWQMLPGVPIAHIGLQSFGERAHTQLVAAVQAARERGARALIIDVRGNAGGLKEQAIDVTSEFLKEGNVFIEKDAKGKETAIPIHPGGQATDLPLCLLIDEGTASSAEIFAGAIQDYERGKLVGTHTFGTGTVLQPFSLSDGSAVLLAVLEWLTPKGRQIWHQGIAADVSVSLPKDGAALLPDAQTSLDAAALARSEDTQLLKAIEVLKASLR